MGKFGLSQAVTRREDQRLLTGSGWFTDDNAPAGAAHGYVFRSPVAAAEVGRLDCSAAARAVGVLGIYTAADLARDGIADIACLTKPEPSPGTELVIHDQPILAGDTVRFVGEGLAFIVAETYQQALDAAELIEFDYTTQSSVTDCASAVGDGEPQVWPDAPSNVSFHWALGERQAVDAAFAAADRIVTLDEVNNRVVLAAIETRAALGQFDAADGKLTLDTGSQMPNGTQQQLAQVFGLPAEKIRVRVGDVGGGFGGKNSLYPEQVLVLYAARRLGRPIKWLAERSEGFLSDYAGRDNVTRGELAVDADGRFIALRVSTRANLGAYNASRGNISPTNVVMACNTYRIPAVHVGVRAVFTHTVPTDPYRGAGRPEILYLVERLVDVAAFDLGIDRIELRRRNLIPATAFPYTTATGLSYDPCDFERIMDEALARSGWNAIDERRAQSAKRNRLRGIGLANYVERCGGGGGLSETARLSFAADGRVTLTIGTMSNGQGHATAYSQIVAERLGLPFDRIELVQGDTDRVTSGTGTGGSWSIPMGGGAVWQAVDVLIERAKQIAGNLLEAASVDIEFSDYVFKVAGTDRQVSLGEVAAAAFDTERAPPGAPPGLDGEAEFKPANYTFPYGCHVCEVEVDPDTGRVELLRYLAVHDFGRALNPLLLAGQVHGGVVQGIGQALTEHTVYDGDGQLLSGSFTDYALPRADDLPPLEFVHRDTPCPGNPLGVKGCGEAGAAGSPPALINAIVNALESLRVRHLDMPATPWNVWRALQRPE